MRKKIVAGNWKMHKNLHEAILLTDDIRKGVEPMQRTSLPVIILAPAFPFLYPVAQTLGGHSAIATGAQNCSFEKSGAFTGEVSVEMIRSTGARYVIIGHSERRAFFAESDALLRKKLIATLESDLSPIYCVGETLAERNSGNHFTVVTGQLSAVLNELPLSRLSEIIIAYEPVWAIGTGIHASAAQAQEMHVFIRQQLALLWGMEFAQSTPILYGGSCNPKNAAELFACPDVDGGLIGGASLQAADFLEIVRLAMGS